MKKIILVFILSAASFEMFAQQNNKQNSKTEISVEIDPATFGFNGYGIHIRVKPKNREHLLIGVGTYAMDFPNVLVDLNENNEEMGWHVRLNQGYGLFGEYHFSEVNKKFFVGAQLALQQYKIQKDFYDGGAKFSNMLLMATGGYTLQPFDIGLYFKFWGGIGYTGKIAGDNHIGNAEHDISPMLIFGALHVGYTF